MLNCCLPASSPHIPRRPLAGFDVEEADSESSASDADLWNEVVGALPPPLRRKPGRPPSALRPCVVSSAPRGGGRWSGGGGLGCGGGGRRGAELGEAAAAAKTAEVPGVVAAVCAVLRDMVQIKYGLVLEEVDLARKVDLHCRGDSSDHCAPGDKATWADGVERAMLLDPVGVVARLNGRTDLQFRAAVGGVSRLVGLSVETRCVVSFEELRREVGRMLGTARAVAVVSSGGSPNALGGGIKATSQVVAVFRESYMGSGRLVCRAAGTAPTLLQVSGDEMLSAVILDPQITRELFCVATTGELVEAPPRMLREEYASLGAWLLPDDEAEYSACHELPSSAEAGHVSALPWARVLAAAIDSTHEPTPEWLRKAGRAFEHPDARGDDLLPLVRELGNWLGGVRGRDIQTRAAAALDEAGLYHGLVGLIDPGLLDQSAGPELTAHAACAVAQAALDVPPSQLARGELARCGAVRALCAAMRRWPDSADVQRATVFALRELTESDALAAEALRHDATHLINEAAHNHPGLADLQRNSTAVMQAMAGLHEEWTSYNLSQSSRSSSRNATMSRPPSPPAPPAFMRGGGRGVFPWPHAAESGATVVPSWRPPSIPAAASPCCGGVGLGAAAGVHVGWHPPAVQRNPSTPMLGFARPPQADVAGLLDLSLTGLGPPRVLPPPPSLEIGPPPQLLTGIRPHGVWQWDVWPRGLAPKGFAPQALCPRAGLSPLSPYEAWTGLGPWAHVQWRTPVT